MKYPVSLNILMKYNSLIHIKNVTIAYTVLKNSYDTEGKNSNVNISIRPRGGIMSM
jgi:hypothetical protein